MSLWLLASFHPAWCMSLGPKKALSMNNERWDRETIENFEMLAGEKRDHIANKRRINAAPPARLPEGPD